MDVSEAHDRVIRDFDSRHVYSTIEHDTDTFDPSARHPLDLGAFPDHEAILSQNTENFHCSQLFFLSSQDAL